MERRKKKSDVETEKATVSGAGGELAAKLVRIPETNESVAIIMTHCFFTNIPLD